MILRTCCYRVVGGAGRGIGVSGGVRGVDLGRCARRGGKRGAMNARRGRSREAAVGGRSPPGASPASPAPRSRTCERFHSASRSAAATCELRRRTGRKDGQALSSSSWPRGLAEIGLVAGKRAVGGAATSIGSSEHRGSRGDIAWKVRALTLLLQSRLVGLLVRHGRSRGKRRYAFLALCQVSRSWATTKLPRRADDFRRTVIFVFGLTEMPVRVT